MVTNLAYFFETSRKVRGGKWVWVKDSNGEQRGSVLLGGTVLNPRKGFDHLWAAQLVQYTPGEGCLIFRSFAVQANAASNATTIYLEGNGYSDAPEVGMYLMIAPQSIVVETATTTVDDSGTHPTASTSISVNEYTGTYAKVTAVEYDEENEKFKVTLESALGTALTAGDILVEADAAEDAAEDVPTGSCGVLVPNPNTFIEADRDLMPTDGFGIGFGIADTANYSISTVYNKQAWIARMQPLPGYVLEKNRSYIDGIFWI